VTQRFTRKTKLYFIYNSKSEEVVFLKSNLSTGGTSVDVTDMMHPENIFLAERISK
jgi:cyanophycin synthetase